MVEQASPLGAAYIAGRHGNLVDGVGVTISEYQPGSIVQLAAWPETASAVRQAIKDVSGLDIGAEPGVGAVTDGKAVFGIAPDKWLAVDEAEGLAARYSAALLSDAGTVTDLSHGRSAIRIAGPKAEWVLAKLYAIDFSKTTFPVMAGLSTAHHDIFTQIQRTGEQQFDLYVFRSFARSFWVTLCHACEEVGYEAV